MGSVFDFWSGFFAEPDFGVGPGFGLLSIFDSGLKGNGLALPSTAFCNHADAVIRTDSISK